MKSSTISLPKRNSGNISWKKLYELLKNCTIPIVCESSDVLLDVPSDLKRGVTSRGRKVLYLTLEEGVELRIFYTLHGGVTSGVVDFYDVRRFHGLDNVPLLP
jgi:hypothetical protein